MAMILDAFIGKFTEVLSGFAKEEVVMVLGLKDELQKLQKRMLRIQSLLEDAEKRKFEDSAINNWLSELKDVMYDADDIIDLCRIQGAQLLADQKKAYKSTTSHVCFNFSSCVTSIPFRHEIGRRIKELNDGLNKIYEDRRQFQLEKSTKSETKITRVKELNDRLDKIYEDRRQFQLEKSAISENKITQTSSLVDDAVVGREVDEASNQLVRLLITGEHREKCRLFAVTGIGGIGKTTLAQKVFNDPRIKSQFNMRIWVCISQNYSETDLLQQVIREAKGDYVNAKTKSELLSILKDSVGRAGSLLLVLDDIWREDVWVDLLRVPLCNANIQVRILVTTRSVDVAKKMGDAYIYPVTQLSVESGWEMLCRRIFSEGQEELACSLKEIELSRYEDLPSHLKQCFLYCSLYPEDAQLSRYELSRLWVAEGFVREHPNSSDMLLEELAEDYFDELVRRNLLLSLSDPFDDSERIIKMHDLYHSLAQFLSRDESSCGTTNLNNSTYSLTKLRRLSLVDGKNVTEILDLVEEHGSSLRTFLNSLYIELPLDYGRLMRLSHLRVLKMKGKHIQRLPDCIGDLVHLRYLDLEGTCITQIPKSIDRLANLQFFSLRSCHSLKTLPTGITRLYNLRCLDLSYTLLSFIPKGLGGLENLNDLSGFVVADNHIDPMMSSGLEELNSLKQLRTLSICNLERAQSTGAIILRELPYLSKLELSCRQTNSRTNMKEQIVKLFNELIPPRGLEELKIKDYFGIRCPNWMSTSSFGACLTRLELKNITSCTHLPSLGQLHELKFLYISFAREVEKIGDEFLGGNAHETIRIAFPKLEGLNIDFMPSLKEWTFGSEVEAREDGEQEASPSLKLLPCLQKLSILNCQLLKQLPQGLRHSGIKKLDIRSSPSLTVVDNLPTLTNLIIVDCQTLSCVEKLDALQELVFCDYQMESLPEWLLKFLQQRRLRNDNDDHFMLRLQCTHMALRGCLERGPLWEIIQSIPHVIASECGNMGGYLRYTKRPYTYDTNL